MAMAFQAHARSISLPSRLHPGSLKVEDRLNKSKALECSSSSSLPSIQARLVALPELYVSFTELIRSSSSPQTLARHDQGRLIEDALNGSVALINTCGAARDMVSSLKDHVRALQSVMRRKSDVESHVAAYVGFRKKSKKEIGKCLRELKQSDNRFAAPLLDADLHVAILVRVLREVVSIAASVFRSVLLFLSLPLVRPKTGAKWSSVLRLKRSPSGDDIVNEVGDVDVAVLALQGGGKGGAGELEAVQQKLRVADSGSERLEASLDALFRSLVQNRVSLLNILST